MHIKEEEESNFKGGLMFNNRQDFNLVNPKKTRSKQERKQTFVLLINLISSVQKVFFSFLIMPVAQVRCL
jgi:hypothetical protein